MNIKILSNTIINRIAAGEVVERPSSAVKELVENAIDAKASRVDIIIENAGRNLITIIDDGIGMNKEELLLATERHTTSKLPDEDINNIEFFGFRGEALPSIASVSRITITSRPQNDTSEFAWSINIIGGEKQEPHPASLSKGTKIEVRDLFFATPARLKFLKTEKTEIHYIVDCLKKIAMANPNIAFSLTSEGKEIFNYDAYDGEEALYNRLNDIIGKGFKENFTYIQSEDSDYSLRGYISAPTYNVGTSNEQYFFINKRPVKDKLLSMAVKIAYQDFIPHGRHPLLCLFLEIDSVFVDVNVHPAKSEVRFKDSNLIRGAVISAIKHGIRSIGKQASDHLTEVAISSFIPENVPSMQEPSRAQYSASPKPNFTRPVIPDAQTTAAIFAPIEPMVNAEPAEFDQAQVNFPLGAACGQIHDTYIISQTEDGMILIDQHAAHERIFYERLKKEILNKQIKTQRLLVPEIIELPEHVIEQLLANREEFVNLGLYFESFGSKEISVTELPALLKCKDVKKLILDIVDDLNEYNQQVSLEKKIQHFLATFACHHSIRAGRNLSIKEMNSLLREMEDCDHTGQCNHGRPTYIKLDLKAIEKLFERS
ncbi:MAG: DNA mismatch repair endonuclease MutL [Rickettsiales bacterium]|jgi:DNA mismatch repair protein MutL|nr:DNA mismatch repair endonuclease MutL [Rickettsiales bacterium]